MKIPEIDSSRFTKENYEPKNILLDCMTVPRSKDALAQFGIEIIGVGKEPLVVCFDERECPIPGIMLVDYKSGREFWFHCPRYVLQYMEKQEDTDVPQDSIEEVRRKNTLIKVEKVWNSV